MTATVGALHIGDLMCAQVNGAAEKLDVGSLWSTYQSGRIVRAASIHGMAREYRLTPLLISQLHLLRQTC
jgi:hypothetical protein